MANWLQQSETHIQIERQELWMLLAGYIRRLMAKRRRKTKVHAI